ncbi:unnamed protein product [Strongylus vulgaris]|uniref:Uncharacterized protein n=1 Tax=Strongylus vulgaris TaxID=40348 RepID=A0A3P7JN06_STRVU|nr:unnamed protein product [Strongylus vulgaris]
MTDAVQYAQPTSQSPIAFDPVDPNQGTGRSPLPVTSPVMPLSPVHSLPEQACQNEAFIWRTKAAQLEIVVKDQLAKANRVEEALRAELFAARSGLAESNCTGSSVVHGRNPKENAIYFKQTQTSDVPRKSTATGEDIRTGTPTRVSPVPLECTLPSCVERKKDLIQENNRLLEQIEEVNMRIHELEDDVTALRHDVDSLEDHRDRLKLQLDVTTQERDSKIAEVAACNIVIARHQVICRGISQIFFFTFS